MNRQSIIKSIFIGILLAATPLEVALAITTPPAATTAQAQRLSSLKAKGSLEIERRTASLTAALTKLQASKKLSAAAKADLEKQIQAELTGLTTLKAKLAAETELVTARADIKTIVNGYRVYALVLPKTRLVVASDRLTAAEAKLTSLEQELQAKLDTLKAGGHDIASLQSALDEMATKLTSATTKTTGLTAKLLAIQPADFNASASVLTTHRQTLKAAQVDLAAARDDAKRVIESLKAIH